MSLSQGGLVRRERRCGRCVSNGESGPLRAVHLSHHKWPGVLSSQGGWCVGKGAAAEGDSLSSMGPGLTAGTSFKENG